MNAAETQPSRTDRDGPPGFVADLRSDTLTRPSPAMREAMMGAVVGDDVFSEDPTVTALQERVAALLGHQAALFTPTGTMANQLGVRAHVRPGEELIAEQTSHVLRAEMGAAAALSGVTTRSWAATAGLLVTSDVTRLMAAHAPPYQVSTTCVVVENTHNFGGGTIQPLAALRDVREATARAGVAVHLDGARLWNAHVATGVPLAEYGALADTVAVCLSKGLGAPVGSLLVGSAEVIDEARVWRKRWGGGMRQVGILAAAGAHALDHHLPLLAKDHARAARFAAAVAAEYPAVVELDRTQTNMVMLDVGAVGWAAPDFAQAASDRGLLGYAVDAERVRYVWHLDVDEAMTDHAIEIAAGLLGR